MEKFEKVLLQNINGSPLGYIKGSCRLSVSPEDWQSWVDKDDSLTDEERTIAFAIGDRFLGNIIVEKSHINNYCDMDNEYNLSMALKVAEGSSAIKIIISCSS